MTARRQRRLQKHAQETSSLVTPKNHKRELRSTRVKRRKEISTEQRRLPQLSAVPQTDHQVYGPGFSRAFNLTATNGSVCPCIRRETRTDFLLHFKRWTIKHQTA